MKKFLAHIALLTLIIGNLAFYRNLSFAQSTETVSSESAENLEVTETGESEEDLKPASIVDYGAEIIYEDNVELGGEVNFKIVFKEDAVLPEAYTVTWNFSDGTELIGNEVTHAFKSSGLNDVHVTLGSAEGVWSDTLSVYVYQELILFVTDQSAARSDIENLFSYAQKQGIFLKIIESFEGSSEFLSEEVLSKKILESVDDLRAAKRIVIWTKSDVGLTLLTRVKRQLTGSNQDLSEKDIVYITNGNISSLENIARGIFATVLPRSIIITRFESLWPFLDSTDINQFISQIDERGYNYTVVDSSKTEPRWRDFMVNLVNFMIDRGIPSNSIKLILVLPVIVTVVSFLKQVVGLSTLGVYTPSIITLSFITLDIQYGLLILVLLLLGGTLIRYLLKRYRLLYIPRMAILLTLVSLVIFLMLYVGAYFNIVELVSISIFPILIMGTLVEKFVSIQTDRGFKTAFLLMIEVLVVSVIAYYVAEWNFMKTLIFGHPELVFVFLFINIILGRWTGLRLFEYWRFRELMGHAEEE